MRVSNFDIKTMRSEDWPAVQRIYSEGIATGNATFETETPLWEKWDQGHIQDCRLVAVNSEAILGWAALSPVSTRRVYSGVAEVSVYVAATARGQGVGTLLLQSLVEQSERCGVWTLQAGIFPENVPSVALHKSCGFREVGVRQKLGQRNGVWRDVLLLERRSSRVGV
jgi:L-amino acid N-acyltransferase YncA